MYFMKSLGWAAIASFTILASCKPNTDLKVKPSSKPPVSTDATPPNASTASPVEAETEINRKVIYTLSDLARAARGDSHASIVGNVITVTDPGDGEFGSVKSKTISLPSGKRVSVCASMMDSTPASSFPGLRLRQADGSNIVTAVANYQTGQSRAIQTVENFDGNVSLTGDKLCVELTPSSTNRDVLIEVFSAVGDRFPSFSREAGGAVTLSDLVVSTFDRQ